MVLRGKGNDAFLFNKKHTTYKELVKKKIRRKYSCRSSTCLLQSKTYILTCFVFAGDFSQGMERTEKMKSRINWGKSKANDTSAHYLHGFGKGYEKGTKLEAYKYNQGVTEEEKDGVNDLITPYCEHLASAAETCFNSRDRHIAQVLKENLSGMPCLAGLFPALSVGKDYHGAAHTDSDYMISVTSMHCQSLSDDSGEILYYFCFPRYKIAVAMRQFDVLVFDSRELHCCTDKQIGGDRDCWIYSLYGGERTMQYGWRNSKKG